MKKTSLALVSTLALGTAAAQSTVTIYGTADLAVVRGTGSLSDRTSMAQGYSSNRIGFRGREDLGGGLYGLFNLEAGYNADDGTGVASNSNNQASGQQAPGAIVFNRISFVGLGGNFGELRLGRDYAPQFYNLATYDPFLVTGIGTSQLLAGAQSLAAAGSGTNAAVVRGSNSLSYFLPPKLGGFYGHAMGWLGENASSAANSNDGNGAGLRLGYKSGPGDIAIAYSKTHYVRGNLEQFNLGGTYRVAFANLIGAYARDTAGALDGRGILVGAVGLVGPHEWRVSYATYKTNQLATDPQTRRLTLGYGYVLSKRTRLYASYARQNNSGGASVALGGAVTAPNSGSNGMELGISHSF